MTLDVLIPTSDRHAALAVTLTSLSAQTKQDFRVVISDQGESPAANAGEVQTATRVLEAHGQTVEVHRHRPRRGMAEQRAFLLEQARAPHALFIDDDLILEPWVLQQLHDTLTREGCGFVGSAVHGLSYRGDVRPHQQHIEFWDGPVTPERVEPNGPAWNRHSLHNAANLWHVQRQLDLDVTNTRTYKVAWVGGCAMYDVAKLRDVGGFDFWRDLPTEHSGEDVLAQIRVMARYGGCAVIPSGVYHLELPTTVHNRRVDAPHVLPIDPPAPSAPRPAANGNPRSLEAT